MLPLFGRRKTVVAEIPMESIDEWCVPNDQELYGRSNAVKASVFEYEANENDENEDITFVSDIKSVSIDVTGVDEISRDCSSVLTFNNAESNDDDDDVIMNESEIDCSNETFSIMNNETNIVDISVSDQSFPTECAFKTVLERLVTLERKFEDLNIKVTKMEVTAQKGNSVSNASIFVGDFIELMQDVMKTGLSYQQQFMGKFIDELDGMFDIDFKDFDPLK
jgi:hypothetical protein